MLSGKVQLDASKVKNHRLCRLGKWYFGTGGEQYGSNPIFESLDSIHAEFYNMCFQAVDFYNQGNRDKSQEMYTTIDELSKQVITLLDSLKQ